MNDVKDPNESKEKIPWYVREETDSTVRLLGGLIIFGLAMGGTFYLEMKSPSDKKYLTPELLHSIYTFIAGWVAGSAALGKKTTNGNQNGGKAS